MTYFLVDPEIIRNELNIEDEFIINELLNFIFRNRGTQKPDVLSFLKSEEGIENGIDGSPDDNE